MSAEWVCASAWGSSAFFRYGAPTQWERRACHSHPSPPLPSLFLFPPLSVAPPQSEICDGSEHFQQPLSELRGVSHRGWSGEYRYCWRGDRFDEELNFKRTSLDQQHVPPVRLCIWRRGICGRRLRIHHKLLRLQIVLRVWGVRAGRAQNEFNELRRSDTSDRLTLATHQSLGVLGMRSR